MRYHLCRCYQYTSRMELASLSRVTGVSALGEARISVLSFLATRGRTRNLRVHPQTIASFGPDSKVMVTGNFSFFTGINLIVGAGAELQLGCGLANYGAEVMCSTRVTIGKIAGLARMW